MCQDCGCHDENKKVIKIDRSVNEDNDRKAHDLWHLFHDIGVFAINVLGSPGSGKTTFIENISDILGADCLAVIQGDLESDIDKVRLEKRNIHTYQINTHSGCHLNADMIMKAVSSMGLKGKKFLLIENVGNLVCPAGVKIGQHMDLVVSSTTEGSDKPKKYPQIFHGADVVVITKTDLAEAVGFDEDQYLSDIKDMNGKSVIFKTSAKDPESFKEVAHHLDHQREHLLEIKHEH